MISTDEQIKKDIVDQIYLDPAVDASMVKVEVREGRVTLTGTVPSFAARRAAEIDATIVLGVASVDNQLRVKYSSILPSVTDDEIKRRITSIFDWNADLDSADIKVSVDSGWVTLEGTVDAYWKKLRAEDLASDVTGVLGITNALAVVPLENVDDRTIAEDIMAALERHVDINVNTVNVKVENGVVTLSGTVPSRAAYQTAWDIARYTGGVQDVINNLTVE